MLYVRSSSAGVVVFVLVVVGVIGLASSADGQRAAPSIVDTGGLGAKGLMDREKAAGEIRHAQKALIEDLIKLAGEEVEPIRMEGKTPVYPYHDAKHLAILLLAELRATDAVPVLLANIEYRNQKSIVTWSLGDPIGGWYPAADALSKIGMPAMDSVLKELGKYKTDCKGRELCAWVVKEILGDNLARMRLEMAIEQAKRDMLETREANLRAAMPYFKTAEERAAEESARPGTPQSSVAPKDVPDGTGAPAEPPSTIKCPHCGKLRPGEAGPCPFCGKASGS